LRIIGNEHSSFGCQGHDGILELEFFGPDAVHSLSDHHKGSGNDGHDGCSEDLLTDAVGGFAVEFLDLQRNLFISVMVLDCPSPEVELDDLLSGKARHIQQIGQKDRDRSIRADQPDDPELDDLGLLALSAAEPLEVLVGRMDQNEVLLFAAGNEGFNGREGRLSRTAEQIVSLVVVPEVGNELIAGISPIEEQDGSGGNARQKSLGLLPFGSMDADHAPGHGKLPVYIIGRCDQALGIVASALMLEAALGIKGFAELLCCREVEFGAIKSINGHPMPKIGWIGRPEAVSQIDRFSQNVPEDGPGNFLASMGKSTPVDSLSIRPEPAAPSSFEELTRFDVHSRAFPAGHQGENEGDEPWEGKLPGAGKVRGGLLGSRVNIFGDKIQKKCSNIGKLA